MSSKTRTLREQIADDSLDHETRLQMARNSVGCTGSAKDDAVHMSDLDLKSCSECSEDFLDEKGQCHYCEPGDLEDGS